MMQKEQRIIDAVTKVLKGYKNDCITIISIHTPKITSHQPIERDESYMERWEEVTITANVRGIKECVEGQLETNYVITYAILALSYNVDNDEFVAAVKNLNLQEY